MNQNNEQMEYFFIELQDHAKLTIYLDEYQIVIFRERDEIGRFARKISSRSQDSKEAEGEGENMEWRAVYEKLTSFPADEYRKFANEGEAPENLINYILSLHQHINDLKEQVINTQKDSIKHIADWRKLYAEKKALQSRIRELEQQLKERGKAEREIAEKAIDHMRQNVSFEYEEDSDGYYFEKSWDETKAAYLNQFEQDKNEKV